MYGYLAFVGGTALVVTVGDFHIGICRRGFIVCEGMSEGFHFDGCSVQFFVTAFVCAVHNKIIRAFRCAGGYHFVFSDQCCRGVIFGHGTQRSECTIVFRGICLCRGAVITADQQKVRFLNGACAVVNFTVRIIKFNVIETIITTGNNNRVKRILTHTRYGIGNIQIVNIECAVALNGLLFSGGTHITTVECILPDCCDGGQKYEGIILLALRMAKENGFVFVIKNTVVGGIICIVFIHIDAYKTCAILKSIHSDACNTCRDCDLGQSRTAVKCACADACYIAGNCNFGKRRA